MDQVTDAQILESIIESLGYKKRGTVSSRMSSTFGSRQEIPKVVDGSARYQAYKNLGLEPPTGEIKINES